MNERDERVCTIYKNKDTGELTTVADLAFIQTEFGLKLYNLLKEANKQENA